ncbi:MAG: hypothetical protein V4474_03290 [Patescibacteria group bacterium]
MNFNLKQLRTPTLYGLAAFAFVMAILFGLPLAAHRAIPAMQETVILAIVGGLIVFIRSFLAVLGESIGMDCLELDTNGPAFAGSVIPLILIGMLSLSVGADLMSPRALLVCAMIGGFVSMIVLAFRVQAGFRKKTCS